MNSGTVLGRYEIVEPLGAGGMGEVYRARDPRLDRDVALKLLPAEMAASGDRIARFEREAKAIAALDHPGIVTIYSVEEHDGVRFITQQLVEGQTLAELIPGGGFELERFFEIATQLADAVAAAHERGITHRDLKPANVMVDDDGRVRVVDFGLAKLAAPLGPDERLTELPTAAQELTEQGMILGTVAYMSPEQAEGKPLDHRTDIFSLGVILYEMATGQRPFTGDTKMSVLSAIVRQVPALVTASRPGLPRHLARVIKLALEKNPERRFQSAKDLRNELAQLREELVSGDTSALGVPGALPSADSGYRLRHLTAAFVVGGLLVALGWWAFRGGGADVDTAPEAPVVRAQVMLPAGMGLAGWRPTAHFAISPDGQTLAYVGYKLSGTAQTDRGLYRRDMATGREELIPGTENADTPFFSPDGRWIAFIGGDSLWRLGSGSTTPTRVLGGLPVVDAASTRVRGATWADADTIVLGQVNGGLLRVSVASGEVRPLTELEPDHAHHLRPSAIPGSSDVLFTIVTASQNDLTTSQSERPPIALLSMRSGEYQILLDFAGTNPFYALSGHLLFGSRGILYARPFDPASRTLSGREEVVIDDVLQNDTVEGTVHASLSHNGLLVYQRPRAAVDRELALVDLEGRTRPLGVPPGPFSHTRLSRDGRRLVSVHNGPFEDQIRVIDLTPPFRERRLARGKELAYPLLNADGSEVFFAQRGAGAGGVPETYRQRLDGTAPELMIGGSLSVVPGQRRGVAMPWDISADGKWLVYHTSNELRGYDLLIASVQDPTVRRRLVGQPGVPSHHNTVASFSPDGRWVAYHSNESGVFDVWVVRSEDGSDKHPLTPAGGSWPRWSSRGDRIYYLRGGWLMSLGFSPETGLPTGAPQELFELTEDMYEDWSVLPDDRGFLTRLAIEERQPPNRLEIVTGWFEELRQKVPTGDPR